LLVSRTDVAQSRQAALRAFLRGPCRRLVSTDSDSNDPGREPELLAPQRKTKLGSPHRG